MSAALERLHPRVQGQQRPVQGLQALPLAAPVAGRPLPGLPAQRSRRPPTRQKPGAHEFPAQLPADALAPDE